MSAPVQAPVARPPRASGQGSGARVWLGILAAMGSAAACLWLAFAAAERAHWELSDSLLVGLALVGPLGWMLQAMLWARKERLAVLELRRQGRQSRRAALAVLDLLPVAAAICASGGHSAVVNRAMAHLLRIERGDDRDSDLDWQTLINTEDWTAWLASTQAAHSTGRVQWLHCTLRLADAPHAVLVQMAAIEGASGPQLAVTLMAPQSETGLTQETVLRLRELLEQAEAEKWQFGQAVHDELGQRLSGIAYFGKLLQRKLQQAQRAEADDAGWLTGLANESMAVARGLARGLVPVGADDPEALAAALSELCENMARSFAMRCDLQVDPGFDPGSSAAANHLYHAIQELITNACKHGHAKHVEVKLEAQDTRQLITVFNDGAGLDRARARSGMGLNGVRNRVAFLGGQFTLTEPASGGVLAALDLPLPLEAPAEASALARDDGSVGPQA